MAIVSYRLNCKKCNNSDVLREEKLEETDWSISSKYYHEGVCPACNNAPSLSEQSNTDNYEKEIDLEGLDHIGAQGAENLREAGYNSDQAIAEATDEEILDVSWVGEKGLISLKEKIKELEPQKRWESDE